MSFIVKRCTNLRFCLYLCIILGEQCEAAEAGRDVCRLQLHYLAVVSLIPLTLFIYCSLLIFIFAVFH